MLCPDCCSIYILSVLTLFLQQQKPQEESESKSEHSQLAGSCTTPATLPLPTSSESAEGPAAPGREADPFWKGGHSFWEKSYTPGFLGSKDRGWKAGTSLGRFFNKSFTSSTAPYSLHSRAASSRINAILFFSKSTVLHSSSSCGAISHVSCRSTFLSSVDILNTVRNSQTTVPTAQWPLFFLQEAPYYAVGSTFLKSWDRVQSPRRPATSDHMPTGDTQMSPHS